MRELIRQRNVPKGIQKILKEKKIRMREKGFGETEKGRARWFRKAMNRDVSTGPLIRPVARWLAPLTH